jgi:hypothetical protein
VIGDLAPITDLAHNRAGDLDTIAQPLDLLGVNARVDRVRRGSARLLRLVAPGQLRMAHGYSHRFGIVHVDFASQRRTPKAGAFWYRDVSTAAACLRSSRVRMPAAADQRAN